MCPKQASPSHLPVGDPFGEFGHLGLIRRPPLMIVIMVSVTYTLLCPKQASWVHQPVGDAFVEVGHLGLIRRPPLINFMKVLVT